MQVKVATTLDGLVTDIATGGLVVALTGLGLSLLLAICDALTGMTWPRLHRVTATCCPPWQRRAALALCGVAVAVPILATPSVGDDRDNGHCATGCTDRIRGLPMPDLPASPAPADPVVVKPGDCLWSIAADELAPGAPDAVIADRVSAWYRVNAPVIGIDPDLIFPGTQLDRPEVSP